MQKEVDICKYVGILSLGDSCSLEHSHGAMISEGSKERVLLVEL